MQPKTSRSTSDSEATFVSKYNFDLMRVNEVRWDKTRIYQGRPVHL
jgi:hypothetical protein